MSFVHLSYGQHQFYYTVGLFGSPILFANKPASNSTDIRINESTFGGEMSITQKGKKM